MITKRMESISDTDLVVASKLCKVFGCEPVEELPGSSARRNLFGCLEDSSAVNELLLRQAAEMAQRSSTLWNFDFAAERPIPGGRYVWTRVDGDRVPRWYAGDYDECTDSVEKENTLTVSKRKSAEAKCGSSGFKIKCNTTKSRMVQTSIKGYMPVQKRRTSSRLRSKRPPDTRFLATCPRDYILSTAGSSKRS